MSSQTAYSSGSNNVIIQVEGDGNTVLTGGASLDLVPVQARVRSKITRDIQILDPVYQAVELVGREEDLRFLQEWLVTGPDIAVTALIGAAGSGKTRLALELLGQLPGQEATMDWQGGLLTDAEMHRVLTLANVRTWDWRKPTLIVVDYAGLKGATLREWFRQLADRGDQDALERPLRILLLERHADPKSGWYSELAEGQAGERVWELFDPAEPRKIAPLGPSADRRSVLSSGLMVIARLHPEKPAPPLAEPGEDRWLDERLAADQWENPLLLLMAAVIAVTDGLHAALSLRKPELAKKIAGWEVQRLKGRARDRGEGEMLAHFYACVTLCKGLERQQALEAAEIEFSAAKRVYTHGPGQAVDDLARYLGCGRNALPALTPDLLAEALLLVVFGEEGAAVVRRLAATTPERIAERLIQTVQNFSVEGYNLAANRLPVVWMRALVEAGQSKAGILWAIDDALSDLPAQTVPLRTLALEVTQALVEQIRPLAENGESSGSIQLPRLLNNLSIRQIEVGRRAEALASAEESVKLYRDLDASNPAAFLPDLAMSLNTLSIRQSEVGRRPEAFASADESVRLYRDLAASNPAAFLPDLARSLNNLSNCQSEVGQRAEALASVEESVKLYRDLAASNPAAFLPDLARSLNNLSNCQSDVGRRPEALASAEESVRLHRDLAASNPAAFLPDLARSLNNLSGEQSAVGQHAEALASAEESVKLYRALAASNPAAFLPDLARSISVLGDRYEELERMDEARNAAAESLVLLAPFFLEYPGSFQELADYIVHAYVRRSKRLHLEMDEELLLPYMRLLEEGESDAGSE